MDYMKYRECYFVNPQPHQRFAFRDAFGVTLYFEQFEEAIIYYTRVLGPPGYEEGMGTRGWHIGEGWLTLLKGTCGNPQNVEITFLMASVTHAEKLQKAFIFAGGQGPPPSDQLMYRPVRFCPVTDPFGTHILVISFLD